MSKDPERSGAEHVGDDSLVRRPRRITPVLASDVEAVPIPAPGEQVRLITLRRFSAIELLERLARAERFESLLMAVYSINLPSAQTLVRLLDTGRIGRVEILMSNLRNAAHREKEVVIRDLLGAHPRVDLWYASSHAKLLSGLTDQGNAYTCEGSGNHAHNSRIEQYVIDNCRDLYDWTALWMGTVRAKLAGLAELQTPEVRR